jgi:ApaG protein
MVRISTHNIEVTVEARYCSDNSLPRENHYFFIYYITIENKGDYTVQLLRRHWDIADSTGEKRTVDGEGVVGETPVLQPGNRFEYNSGCNLASEIGYMRGHYTLVNLADDREFNVNIPPFELVVPAKLN